MQYCHYRMQTVMCFLAHLVMCNMFVTLVPRVQKPLFMSGASIITFVCTHSPAHGSFCFPIPLCSSLEGSCVNAGRYCVA